MNDLTVFLAARYDEEMRRWGAERVPPHVVADITAKRWILAAWPDHAAEWTLAQVEAGRQVKDLVLRHLASVYSEHPDFRRDWTP